MLNFEHKSLGNSKFLVYNINQGEEINPIGLFDVSTEHIKGFCPTKYSESDNVVEYDITDKVTLNEFFDEVVCKREILCVLDSILDALIVARNKKIDLRNLIFDKDYFYANPETVQVSFIVLPIVGATNPVDLNGFFKDIVFSLQYDKSEDTGYVVELLNYLNKNTHFVYEDFKAFISDISGQSMIEEIWEYEEPVAEVEPETEPEEEPVIEIEVPEKKGVSPMFRQPTRKELTADDILGK